MGQSRKYNMGPELKIQAEANAENASGPHDVGRPSAAPHHMVAAASRGRHHVVILQLDRWYFQHLPPRVFSGFCSILFLVRLFHQLPCTPVVKHPHMNPHA